MLKHICKNVAKHLQNIFANMLKDMRRLHVKWLLNTYANVLQMFYCIPNHFCFQHCVQYGKTFANMVWRKTF